MKRSPAVVVGVLISTVPFITFAAYEPTAQDERFVEQLQENIDAVREREGKERGLFVLARLQEGQYRLSGDAQAEYFLSELEDYSFEKLATYTEPTDEQEPTVVMTAPSTSLSMSAVDKTTFFENYSEHVASGIEPPTRCVKYYELIDEIARRYDFPTPLIIATWWREHSCHLSNPANGMGLFQITSHVYPPGEIGLEELENQVEHFIAFSRAKWGYYDAIQKFDPLPIGLSYDSYDLRSIQKHAVMYNGAYSGVTPDNSTYANENFGTGEKGRDGVVAMFLKVLGWEIEQL